MKGKINLCYAGGDTSTCLRAAMCYTSTSLSTAQLSNQLSRYKRLAFGGISLCSTSSGKSF
jgi:hypothetical protein